MKVDLNSTIQNCKNNFTQSNSTQLPLTLTLSNSQFKIVTCVGYMCLKCMRGIPIFSSRSTPKFLLAVHVKKQIKPIKVSKHSWQIQLVLLTLNAKNNQYMDYTWYYWINFCPTQLHYNVWVLVRNGFIIMIIVIHILNLKFNTNLKQNVFILHINDTLVSLE